MKKLFVLIVAAIVMAGCQQTQWVRANTTAQQFNADKYACEMEALRMYPNNAGQPIGNPTYTTHCNGNYTGTSDGAIMMNCHQSRQDAPVSWIDTNSIPRASMEEQCLRAKGYFQQPVGNNSSYSDNGGLLGILGLDGVIYDTGTVTSQRRICSFPQNSDYLAGGGSMMMEVKDCENKGGTPQTW